MFYIPEDIFLYKHKKNGNPDLISTSQRPYNRKNLQENLQDLSELN